MATTIKDIARICNVSPSTVSKVIKNYPNIPEETKKRVWDVIEKYHYVPNYAASSLSSGDYRNIGILGFLNDKESPLSRHLFSLILASFQKEMNLNGYNLVFIDKRSSGRTSFLKDCEYKMVAGVLMFGNLYDEQMQEVMDSSIPCVGFDYEGEKINSVHTKGEKALYDLTSYIISHGHKDIIFISGDQNHMTDNRIKGFKKAMLEHNLPLYDYSVLSIPYGSINDSEVMTEKIINEHPNVTAIIYPDDLTALVGFHKLKLLNKRVPEDISIAGFDGTIFSEYISPALTTMKQDVGGIGKSLARLLIDQIRYPSLPIRKIAYDAVLFKGETISSRD